MTPQQAGETLSQPIRINKLTLKNRIVMGPMAANSPGPDGGPTAETIAFFESRARGGAGLIIVGGIEATPRRPDALPGPPGLRFSVDTFIDDFRRVADAVHAHGVPIIAELVPSLGRMERVGPNGRLISASPKNVVLPEEHLPRGFVIPGGITTATPEEATVAEIEAFEREMIKAAERVHRAGWDGVEVAAHASYFANSFISPRTNWRTDQYGGSVENRARMLTNTVRGIRERLGPDFIVGLRITSNDHLPDGQGVHGFAAVAREVEKAGLDYVALSPGCYEKFDICAPVEDGLLVETGDARVFKDALSVPVLLQGLHDPLNAAAAIADGHGDMVMLARQMIADPEYARKACEGRRDEIVWCDRDNQCLRRLLFAMPIRCSVNPRMGVESRKPGSLPPPKRFLQAPKEKLILTLTSSHAFMAFVLGVMRRRAAKQKPAH